MLRVAGFILVWGLLSRFAIAAHAETLTYTLTPHFDTGRLDVEVEWETANRQQSYLAVSSHFGRIEHVADLLSDVQFAGGECVGPKGAIWPITHRRGATVTARYTVSSGRREFGWDDSHYPIVTREYFHGIGNAFLLVPQISGYEKEEYEVMLRWKLPEGSTAGCSWGVGQATAARMRAADLRNSVYVAGKLVTQDCRADGLDITVVAADAFAFSAESLARVASSIIKAQCDFMGEKRFPPFVITAIPVGPKVREGESKLSGSGLYNSFALMAAPKSMLNDAAEHLLAHELFHYWNGRTLEAADPERLVYWFTEGLTDYYALRILWESGRWDTARYAKWINRHIREYFSNPARNASNERIQQDYWNQRDTVGEVAYERGLLLGLRWNRMARDRGVADGLDRLFLKLVERGRGGALKLTNGIVRQAGVETLGAWFGPEFDRYVERAETIELPADVLQPKLAGRESNVYDFDAGFAQEASLKAKRVQGVRPGGPAAEAGVKNGDELAGWSIGSEADQPVILQIKRGKDLKKVEYLPRGTRRTVIQFEPDKKPHP